MLPECPCGSKKRYLQCCGLYLSGKEKAPTPEALMRSRYSAFVKGKFPYLARTMRGMAAEQFDMQAVMHDFGKIKWLKLEVLQTQTHENSGIVEFKAHFKMQGQVHILHEVSQFEKLNNEWFYVGQI